jgi:UPF0755 protein
MPDDVRTDAPPSMPASSETASASHAAQERSAPIGRSAERLPITPRSARARLEPERVPDPRRPSRRARHPIVIAGNAIFTVILLLLIVTGGVLVFGKEKLEAPGPLASDRVVIIPPRLGSRDISELLQREGVIAQPWWVFVGGVFATHAREGLKAGEYNFQAHASLHDVINTLVEGKVVQHQITIPEGLTSEQIVARLLQSDVLTGSIKEIPPEGSLLPDTYNFRRGDTREQAIQRMRQAQKRVLEAAWERRSPDLPLKTPEQLLVLASIVEKETGRADERPRVAAVFMNRLRQGMRLQSDPTIIYGLVGGKGSLGRPIMRSEIEQPTPYNTYAINGLPPGPIANPGRASIEATANPSRTKELYFVADGSGGHVFAETLEQHQRNVARLRQIEQQAREGGHAKTPPAAAPAPADAAHSPARTRGISRHAR